MSKPLKLSPDELETVVEKAQNGDGRAFTRAYDALVVRIYRFVYSKIGNRDDAQDIVAETWKSVWLHLPTYKKGNFTAYVFRIAHTTCISFIRRQKRTFSLDEVKYVRSTVSAEDTMIRKELKNEVLTKLKQLPSLYEEIILLRFVEGFSIKQTAHIVGKPSLVVRVTQHRAIKKLQQLCNGI